MATRIPGTIRDHAVAFGWGVAEATVFFIVPDVWTSRVALRHPRRAFATTLSATAGAVLGGAIVHRWAARTPAASSAATMARIPAIDAAMVDAVDEQVARSGYRAMLTGPTRGVPYKLYARAAGSQGLPLGGLLAWTGPARIVRFVLVTGMFGGLAAASRRAGLNRPGRGLARVLGTPERAEKTVHALGWTLFYAWYFHAVRAGKLGRA
ncbi:MAG: hypothetical protein KDB60_10120 [Propionibacteriaceae bacterium]|nr:hypothetical protein [Propionibacteriaceae bacterium]